ncbi:MAG: response regulator transcription factor [Candidatus Omnitrophota bacterium]|nr:response regulator transcription factor [Candidatus Omnitrophota bacterium]
MLTILIVEDHKDFRQAVRHFLEVSNVKADLLEASSGEEGVLLAKRIKPQIVLMDFWLRGMNGMEAATQIKASVPNCSIIMLTMFDIKDIEPLDNQNLIKAFISKSDLCDKLIPSISKILDPAILK